MTTSFYNQSSAVEDFLKNHRSRLDEDKFRLKRRGQDDGSPMVGILPSNEGRDRTIRQKETNRRNEYRQYLQEREGHTHNRQMEPRPSSISEIRRQMQKERETEITFGTDSRIDGEPTGRRRGVARDPYTDPISERSRTPVKGAGQVEGVSLGMIGYRKEESPEEKHQRQSKYRAELFEQMKRKGKEVTTATSMGPTQLFREDDEAVTRRRPAINKGEGPNMERRSRRERPIDPVYSDEDEDIKFDHYHPRPSRYRDYPYYPPPHGPHPPPVPHPPSQYHPGYVQPYYYPSPYPQMYPPPMPHPPTMPHPHPPPPRSYYMEEDNPYLSERYGRSQLNRSPPRVRSPSDYPTRSGRSPTLPNKESRRSERYEQPISEQKSKATELRAILDQQIKDKKAREAKEKREIDKLYRKIDTEAEVYDPWGKPGCGAPLTDPTGNLVAERGQLRQSFEETSPRVSGNEEERKRAAQEKMKRDLEEQIRENKERQMRDKYKRQQEEELEEKKLLDELRQSNAKGRQEVYEERKKKQTEMQQERTSVVSQPQLTPQQLVELQLKEENEKKRIKEEEERRRLERLAEKMASDTRPAWKQRSLSPPIPTLRGNRSPQIPPYPSAHPPVEPHPQAPIQNSMPPPPETVTHPPERMPRPSNNDRSHSPPIPTHRTNRTVTSGRGQVDAHAMEPPNHHIPTSTNNERGHMTAGHVTSAAGHVTNGQVPVYEREQSRELMKGLSDLKQQIRSTMSTTSATETSRQRNPVHSKRNSLSSATLQQFNRLKYARPSEGRMRFLSQYPDLPRTNTALETQQEALLQHQSDDGHLHQRDSNESVFDSRHRPPTGLSNFTIATMDIDSLANRNEERARRLEAILNVDRGSQQTHLNPQTVLNEFLSRQENPHTK